MIERMPSVSGLDLCCLAWDLSDLTFVRKMENIVYSGKRYGETVFLRLTTPIRRSKQQIEAELHFIAHLAQAGLGVPQVLPNSHGQSSMTIKDGDQQYEAVVFARMEGAHPSHEQLIDPAFLSSLGVLIANMHQISEKYERHASREQWHEERGIRHALDAANSSLNATMRKKLNEMVQSIHQLQQTPINYGLVHADIIDHNLFIKADGTISLIDFDDSCYHFHAFDLAIAIYAIANRFSHPKPNDLEKTWITHLVNGYQSVRPLSQEQIDLIPRFIDFACVRMYFWIEHHQTLNTFESDVIERIALLKQWAMNRVI